MALQFWDVHLSKAFADYALALQLVAHASEKTQERMPKEEIRIKRQPGPSSPII